MVWRSPRTPRATQPFIYTQQVPTNLAELAAALRAGIQNSQPLRGAMSRTSRGQVYACALGAVEIGAGTAKESYWLPSCTHWEVK